MQFAYSNQMFAKLKRSRLQIRKYLSKLWKKILKSPLNAENSVDTKCKEVYDEFRSESINNTETDFFDLEQIKSGVMEYYQNSICRDVFEGNAEGENSVKTALAQGTLLLLVKVYSLEVCLASVIAWDSFDLSDVFEDELVVKTIVNNMMKEIPSMDTLAVLASDILKKQKGLSEEEFALELENSSAFEYLIKKEGRFIAKSVGEMFRNSQSLTLDLNLEILRTSDTDFIERYQRLMGIEKDILKPYTLQALAEAGYPYVADVRFSDNIYTMNYGHGRQLDLGNEGYGSQGEILPDQKSVDIYGFNAPPDALDLASPFQKQKLFFHSLPVDHHTDLDFEDYKTKFDTLVSEPGAKAKPDLDNRYHHDQYGYETILGNAGFWDKENTYERIIGNDLNAKFGNITIQPFVKIVDTSAKERKKFSANIYSNPASQPGADKCSPLELEYIVEAFASLGEAPVLQEYRKALGICLKLIYMATSRWQFGVTFITMFSYRI